MKGNEKIPLQDIYGKLYAENTFKSKLGAGAARILREDFGEEVAQPSTSQLPQREIAGIDKFLQT